MASLLFRGRDHAQIYAKFRPYPPTVFINNIIDFLKQKIDGPYPLAVDIGCGTGQSTVAIAPHFEKVVGVDVSEAQIECAQNIHSAANIEYKVSSGEKLPFKASSVQCVTFGQSIHWFDTKEVFNEVRRVLVPNGVVATYAYWIPLPTLKDVQINSNIKELIVQYLHEDQLGPYWNDERYIVKNHYAEIQLPFQDSWRTSLVQTSESSLSDYIGYLSSWSAFQKMKNEDKSKAENLLEEVKNEIIKILKEEKPSDEIILPLCADHFMIMGRK